MRFSYTIYVVKLWPFIPLRGMSCTSFVRNQLALKLMYLALKQPHTSNLKHIIESLCIHQTYSLKQTNKFCFYVTQLIVPACLAMLFLTPNYIFFSVDNLSKRTMPNCLKLVPFHHKCAEACIIYACLVRPSSSVLSSTWPSAKYPILPARIYLLIVKYNHASNATLS